MNAFFPFVRHVALVLAPCLALLSACSQTVVVRGVATNIAGEALPGVVVRAEGTDFESLSNANGQYALRVPPGQVRIEYAKTGYAPVLMDLAIQSPGLVEITDVALWHLPLGEGVYWLEGQRYRQTDHPRVNRYRGEGNAVVFGTPVNPQLIIPWADPEIESHNNPPMLVAHRLPAYDARLHCLRQMPASPAVSAVSQTTQGASTSQFTEEIWVADRSVPLRSLPLDEPQQLLVELRATHPLEPGVYAIHWGALEGYESIDPRAFIFAIDESVASEDAEIADEPEEESNAT